MGYSSDILKSAYEEITAAAKKRQSAYFSALYKLEKEVPELYEIKLNKQAVGAKLVSAAMRNDTAELDNLRRVSEELQAKEQEIYVSAGIVKPVPECPICNDSGYKGTALCDCVLKLAKEKTMSALSSSVPLENSTFEDFSLDFYPSSVDANGVSPKKRMSDILKFCKDYAAGFNKKSDSILLLGAAGLGKTHLSLAIASRVLEKGYGVIYNTAGNMFLKLEEEYFSYRGNTYIDALLDVDLLIIDDLGTEYMSKFTQSAFYNIINTRILKHKPTIISTNLSVREIEEKYSARISSRIIGSFSLKKLIGMDIRQIKATRK